MTTLLCPFACFGCQKSFKRAADEHGPDRLACPHCGAAAIRLSRKFKAPQKADDAQWAKVRYLVENGFRFETVRDETGRDVPYPATRRDAAAFVRRYGTGRPPTSLPPRKA